MKTLFKLLLLILGLAGIFIVYDWLRDNKIPNFAGTADLYVTEEMGPEDVVASLDSQLTVLSVNRLRKVFRKKDVASFMKPGHYRVTTSSTSVYVARMLNNGWQSPVSLTLAGSLRTRAEIARKISRQISLDSASVRRSLEDPEFLAPYGVTPETVFEAFFPATYEIYWTASLADVMDRCRKASDAFWTDEKLAAAAKQGLTRRQAVTLASIVKGESNYKPELRKIAGVYLNRLDRGMLLQADPTVAFCYDYELKRILFRHLEFDSPYNTYKYAGLPPGPINVPDDYYIDAVLNADRGNGNLYFCASPSFDGTHVFAKSAEGHARNASAFRNALNNRG